MGRDGQAGSTRVEGQGVNRQSDREANVGRGPRRDQRTRPGLHECDNGIGLAFQAASGHGNPSRGAIEGPHRKRRNGQLCRLGDLGGRCDRELDDTVVEQADQQPSVVGKGQTDDRRAKALQRGGGHLRGVGCQEADAAGAGVDSDRPTQVSIAMVGTGQELQQHLVTGAAIIEAVGRRRREPAPCRVAQTPPPGLGYESVDGGRPT